MKIMHFLGAITLFLSAFSFSAVSVHAAEDFVTVKHAKAKWAGRPACASKYPAGKGQGTAFRHGLTRNCYSCPAGYKRTINPNIKAANACEKVVKAKVSWSKATYRGKRKVGKPKGAFFDPRKGGEWWKCPSNRPRRTAYAVTHKYACATKNILGEKLARAKFVSKTVRKAPKGSFFDPRSGGEYWSCPAGYGRTVVYPVNHKSRACKKTTPARAYNAKAKHRGTWGCKKGAFKNGLENACYTCPATYKRSAAIGRNLHRNPKACVYVKVKPGALANAEFLRWAKADLKKFERFTKPIIAQASKVLKSRSTLNYAKKIVAAKNDRDKARNALLLSLGMRSWLIANGPRQKASLDVRRARLDGMEIRPVLSGPRIDVASASQLTRGLVYPRKIVPAGRFQLAQAGRSRLKYLFPTFSVSFIAADISLGFGYTASLMWAWDVSYNPKYKGVKGLGTKKTELYASHAWSVGITAGLDAGIEFGFWTDPNHKLSGDNHGFVVAVSVKGGLGMSHWWNYGDKKWQNGDRKHGIRPKYLGMTIFPQVGVSAEAEYARGNTIHSSEKK